jgi:hypothetical protein
VAHSVDPHRAPYITETWPPTSSVGFWVHFTYQESALQFRRSRQFLCDGLQILNVIKGKGRQNKIKCGSLKGELQTVG